MGLNIRRYHSGDFGKALNIDGRPSKRRLQKLELVEHGAYYCYVADDDGAIVGFIIMEDLNGGGSKSHYMEDLDDDNSKSHYMAQINAAQKRKGIGRKLVTRVFQEIGVGGHVSLCVNTDNLEAISFYESLGFRWSGYVKGYRKNQDKFWYAIDLK